MWLSFVTGFNLGVFLILILHYTTPSRYVKLKTNHYITPIITISCTNNVCDTTYTYKTK